MCGRQRPLSIGPLHSVLSQQAHSPAQSDTWGCARPLEVTEVTMAICLSPAQGPQVTALPSLASSLRLQPSWQLLPHQEPALARFPGPTGKILWGQSPGSEGW